MTTKIDGPLPLEKLVQLVDYVALNEQYTPGLPSLNFINFIKMVNGVRGEENKSPVMHMEMIDVAAANPTCLYVAARGTAKTTLMHEYMFLYLATYGSFFDFGEVSVAIYVSDTIDNGIKSMRKNLEFRWMNSEFLQKFVPGGRFTDTRWEFTNLEGKKLCVRGFGASTGVRGFKEYGQRPTWCGMDDLMSDKNAESPTITQDIRNIIYKAARQALHPRKRKMIWTGTPFNKKDPLYQAAGSRGWTTKCYPLCETFPCAREDFRGAWPDRFGYDFVRGEYDMLLDSGEIQAFNQELMLKIASDENRLVAPQDIQWYKRENITNKLGNFNIYITTDFATSEKQSADFSTIFVFALNNIGQWFFLDGICKRQLMSENVKDLFRLVQRYKPMSVGVEVSGQQGGFISWIEEEMMSKNIWFSLASENNKGKKGVRPISDKLKRFTTVQPWFNAGLMFFPLELKEDPMMLEIMDELESITLSGIKSLHDDCIDPISMLSVMPTWKPSAEESDELEYMPESDSWGTVLSPTLSVKSSYVV